MDCCLSGQEFPAGAEGALRGASIMPGGAKEAWPLIRPLLQDMAAKAATEPLVVTGWGRTEPDILLNVHNA